MITNILTSIFAITHTSVFSIFNIALHQENVDYLERKLLDISNPCSENYGEYLSKDFINTIIEPIDKWSVINWLETNNISILHDYGDGLKVFGELSQIEDLFDIHYEGTRFHHTSVNYSIPIEFKQTIDFIEGFNIKDNKTYPEVTIKDGKNVDNRYVGKEVFYWLYNISDETACINSSIASIEYGSNNGFNQQDLYDAQKLNNVTLSKVNHIIDNSLSSDDESQLDVQMIGINSDKYTDIWYWNNEQWLYSLAVDVFNNESAPDILSMSYGWAEDDQCSIATCGSMTSQQYVERVNLEYIKLALRGISVVVASGDAGSPGRTSEGCDPKRPLNAVFPGSSPWVTSVGATYIKANNDSHRWNSTLCQYYGCATSKEQYVTNYNDVGWTSGSGIAKYSQQTQFYQKANNDYLQSGVSLPNNFPIGGRMYPDVSLIGHYCPVVDNGGILAIDGTSCSTPLFATIISKLNQFQISRNKSKLGWINPVLYQMYYDESSSFDDLTNGFTWCSEFTCCDLNERNGSDFGFKATKGYDPVYGLGTPNVGMMKEWLIHNI